MSAETNVIGESADIVSEFVDVIFFFLMLPFMSIANE